MLGGLRFALVAATATIALPGCGSDDPPVAQAPAQTVNVAVPQQQPTEPATPTPAPAATTETPTDQQPTAAQKKQSSVVRTNPGAVPEEFRRQAQQADTRPRSHLDGQQAGSFSSGSPKRAVADYAAAWRSKNYAAMARLTQSGSNVDGPASATDIKAWAFARPIASFRIGKIATSGSDSKVTLTVEMDGATEGRPRAWLSGPIRLTQLGGDWLVNPNDPPTLRRIR